jgi:hypothetical protein
MKFKYLTFKLLSFPSIINALIHPIEIRDKHFYDSITDLPVCKKNL